MLQTKIVFYSEKAVRNAGSVFGPHSERLFPSILICSFLPVVGLPIHIFGSPICLLVTEAAHRRGGVRIKEKEWGEIQVLFLMMNNYEQK